ncbi:uncharacterized protein LOC109851725 [Pseudomyrmex gracilis]|uniref:uncharacterized protein LOC109851725 n=1 Tax=Pseudomyrmex gracilis TaxID=219809 RepID=UPI000994EC7A|nr:uncharacterized protein LOC109851725 [Pseudomyrmex gracilis]
MSKNEDCGYISLLYSIADKPLDLWSKYVSCGGKIRRIKDDTLYGDKVLEITGSHNSAIVTNITTPAETLDVMNIKLPILVLVIKNLNLQFKLEVQIIDKEQYRRRFSFLTYNLERSRINARMACIPLKLEECWNTLEINLQTLCHEAYKTNYKALQRIIIYANCCIRRVYLQDRHYNNNETPIEIYQAFLHMYMLKWGINAIDEACQTEGCYTGFAEQPKDLSLASIDSIGVLQTKLGSKPIYSTGKLKNLSTLNSVINLCKSNTLKRKHMSLDTLNNAIKMRDKNVFIRKNEHFKESLANNIIVENKLQMSNVKKTEQNPVKTHKAGNQSFSINMQNKNHILRPMTLIESKKVMRNQVLKTRVSETLFEENGNSEYTNLQEIRNAKDICVNSKEHNNSNNIQIEKTASVKNAEFQKSLPSFLSAFKFARDSLEKIDKKSDNTFNTQNDKLCIISEDKHVKENNKNIADSLRSLTDRSAEYVSDHIPPVIEKEAATLEEINPRNRYLGIDMATSNFITAYHFTNRKFLKKLKDKGLAMTQVELSLCDMTNRRKFYNQQKFINKQRWCIDKCTGL